MRRREGLGLLVTARPVWAQPEELGGAFVETGGRAPTLWPTANRRAPSRPRSYALTSEEKMRRRWNEWAATGAPTSGDAPSFQELVSSFRRVVAADGAPELDVRAMVGDGAALEDALAVSRSSVIEWMEVQESLIQQQEKAKDKKFVFQVKAP